MKRAKSSSSTLSTASAALLLVLAGGLVGFVRPPHSTYASPGASAAASAAGSQIPHSWTKLDQDPLAYAKPASVLREFKLSAQRSEILRGHRWDHMVAQLERHMMSFATRYCQVAVRLSPGAVAVLQRSAHEVISPCQMSESTAKHLAQQGLLRAEVKVSPIWTSSWPRARALDTEAYAQDVVVRLSRLSSSSIVWSKSAALSVEDREHLRLLSQMLNQQMDLYAVLNGRIFEISKNVDALLLVVSSSEMSDAFDRRREETFLSWRAMWMDVELRQQLEIMQALSVSVGSPEMIELGRLMIEVNRLVEVTTADERADLRDDLGNLQGNLQTAQMTRTR